MNDNIEWRYFFGVLAAVCALLLAPAVVRSLNEGFHKEGHSPPDYKIHNEGRTLSLSWNNVKEDVSWGLTLPSNSTGEDCGEGDQCLDFGVAKVVVTTDEHCQTVEWTTRDLEELKDCVHLHGHWYGGGEQYTQPWPIEKTSRRETPFVPSDMLQSAGLWYGGVIEAYWISSLGLAVRVDDTVPLFVSLPDHNDTGSADQLCFSAKYHLPFAQGENALGLKYHLCTAENVKEVHEITFPKFFSLPTGVPDDRMMQLPIWSTWAEYYTEINDSRVLNLAQTILDKGFNNSQIEIDDNWETCYGDAIFDPIKFPDPKGLVQELHELGYRVTLWIHPFINDNCDSFQEASSNGYLIKDAEGVTQLTHWWQGNSAGIIDFTNQDAVLWWNQRLSKIREDTNMDSFKFDAGEANWLPDIYTLQLDKQYWPNGYTQKYVEAISQFGDVIETRVGHSSQEHPIFVRMLDRTSIWGYANGIKTLIPAMLHFGIVGYPFVLPDMIGGNGYAGVKPPANLYKRWAQANVLMPSVQFSILPWHYEEEIVEDCKTMLSFRSEYADLMRTLAQESVDNPWPMIRPLWWLCPELEECLLADQQYLVGDDLIIAPVVSNDVSDGHTVVLPPGSWQLQDTSVIYTGPAQRTLFPNSTDLESIVYFTRLS